MQNNFYNSILTIVIHIVITFSLTVIFGKVGLPILKKIKAGQNIREEGPESHQEKAGTPTMGGWFFLLSILTVAIGSNFFLQGTPVSLWYYVVALFAYATVGFIDDYLKIILKRNEGLTSLQKIILQILSVVLLFVLFKDHFARPVINLIFYHLSVPLVLYILFAAIWFIGFSNATNLTDGLDGLLGTTASIAFAAFGIIALMQDKFGTALFSFIVLGAMLGFLVFNKHPAQVFMGDTGSLAIGALLAAISIELHMEFYLLLVGIVFVLETASVMLQVAYFKYTKKRFGAGKRIFLMSPYHHHLELSGNSEINVVWKLSALGVIGAILGIVCTYFLA